MAKPRADSKLAIAGVLLVKEPPRSSRPIGIGLEIKETTGEQLVRARLWQDPLAAVQRGVSSKPHHTSTIVKRLKPLKQALSVRANQGERITVLLATTSGSP